MKNSLGRLGATFASVVALTAVVAVGCGSTDDTDPTPVQTWKITPASGGQTATPASAETPAGGAPTAQATSGGGGASATLQLAGVNSVFDPEALEAPAGMVTIEFDNQDGGIPHNLHVFEGDEADEDESVGSTDIEPGPVTQTLTLDLEAGEYFYQCDVHPTTMTGTLTVT
jgi:plastocyanin